MLVVHVDDPVVRRAIAVGVARPDEDVIWRDRAVQRALDWAAPRAVIHDGRLGRRQLERHHVVRLHTTTLERWENEWLRMHPRAAAHGHLGRRVAELVAELPERVGPADVTLATMSRTVGRRLPPALNSLARRVLEFPSWYTSLERVAELCDISRGALKARFRRRGMPSPTSYLRWLRALAVIDELADPEVTVAVAARRCGYTSDGNLCRALDTLAGTTPTEARDPAVRRTLLIRFAWTHLDADALEAWAGLDELFWGRTA